MFKNFLATIFALMGAGFLAGKLVGNPENLGLAGYAAFILVGIFLFLIIFIPLSGPRH